MSVRLCCASKGCCTNKATVCSLTKCVVFYNCAPCSDFMFLPFVLFSLQPIIHSQDFICLAFSLNSAIYVPISFQPPMTVNKSPANHSAANTSEFSITFSSLPLLLLLISSFSSSSFVSARPRLPTRRTSDR